MPPEKRIEITLPGDIDSDVKTVALYSSGTVIFSDGQTYLSNGQWNALVTARTAALDAWKE